MSFNTSLSVSASQQSQNPSICPENEINILANTFEQKGNLLFQDCGKLVYQCGYYVLKEVYLPQPPISQPQPEVNNGINVQQQASCNPVVAATATYPPSPVQSQQTDIDCNQYNQMIMEKRIKDCLLLQNEYTITSKMNCETAHIAKPIDFKATSARCMLFSPFMSSKDAFTHLISKNAGVFQKIDYASLDKPDSMNQDQIDQLNKVRNILFGTMKLAVKIGEALKFLHEDLNIAHNDIKPDNFFAHFGQHPLIPCSKNYDYSTKSVTSDDDGVQYYLGDFAYSKQAGFSTQKEAKKFFLQKVQSYFTPEIFAWLEGGQIDLQNFEKQYDVFAFGISLFQILFQINPYNTKGCHLSDFSFNLLQSNPDKFWTYLQNPLSVYGRMTNIDLMKDLLSKMLERDPSKRPNISQVLQHPWLANIQHYFLQLAN